MCLFAETIQILHESTEGFKGLLQHLDPKMVSEILAKHGSMTVRSRKLPQEVVLWLVIGMGLFRDRSVREIALDLNLCIDGVPAASSLCDARHRVKPAVLQDLTTLLGREWANDLPNKTWHGLKTFGIDGTVVDLFDSEQNEDEFGRHKTDQEKSPSCYPQARFVGLVELNSMLVTAGVFGPLAVSEQGAAKDLLGQIPGDSVTIVDRGFQSILNFFLATDKDKNRHILGRVKKNFQPTWVRDLSPHSYVVSLSLSKEDRKKFPHLINAMHARIIEYQVGERKETIRVMTSLLDEEKYPCREVAELYHLRWRIETAFRDIKSTLLGGGTVLRSKSPNKVRQEFWAILLANNLIRREMIIAAAQHGKDGADISFTAAMQQIHAFFISRTSALAAHGTLPKAVKKLHENLWLFRLPKPRPERVCPRWVKRRQPSKFPRKPPRAPSGLKMA